MKKTTPEIIKELVTDYNLTLKGEVISATDNMDGTYDLEVCNPIMLRSGSMIVINAVNFTVISVVGDIVTVSGSSLPFTGEFTFPIVYFFNGTPIMTGNELSHVEDADDKTPFLYLYEPMEDEFYEENSSVYDRKSALVLFFLDQANYNDWDIEKHYSEAVKPMYLLATSFVKYLEKNVVVGKFENYKIKYFPNFTIIRTDTGGKERVFADDLSGVQLTITLPFEKQFCCKKNYVN